MQPNYCVKGKEDECLSSCMYGKHNPENCKLGKEFEVSMANYSLRQPHRSNGDFLAKDDVVALEVATERGPAGEALADSSLQHDERTLPAQSDFHSPWSFGSIYLTFKHKLFEDGIVVQPP